MNEKPIDELVAEKVMGWIKPPETSILKSMWVETPLGTVHPELPKFSTNIQDAWLVVEKFASEGLYFSIVKWIDGGYVVEIEKDSLTEVGSYESKTAPMAICIAALKAVGEEWQ
ncbi:BC1872 family protein [Bacillus cereus]|uniref:Phage ABA sandwich domain-containing protein n=1 Tax=Bacillus cereus HuA4-10 TaxID=1053206 RepID=J8DH12_BACCE|nr:hypothetical protein [Bacillus cereus]EJQ84096.1 hypothetical protein IGC_01038 [Bacillus cereus HuA4-10]